MRWFANFEYRILHDICYEFIMFTFYWENKFLIGQTRKLQVNIKQINGWATNDIGDQLLMCSEIFWF